MGKQGRALAEDLMAPKTKAAKALAAAAKAVKALVERQDPLGQHKVPK